MVPPRLYPVNQRPAAGGVDSADNPPRTRCQPPGPGRLVPIRAIRKKNGMAVPDDGEHLRALTAEGRVLLAITPDEPPSGWTGWGLD